MLKNARLSPENMADCDRQKAIPSQVSASREPPGAKR